MNPDHVNILYIIDSLDAGGAEQLLVNITKELSRVGNTKLHVAATLVKDGLLKQKLNHIFTFIAPGLNISKAYWLPEST